jgi:hypothetical protein
VKPTITVLYSCKGCGVKDRPVALEGRESDEDVVEWMKKVQSVVGAEHGALHCPSPTFDLKVPMPADADWIGQATKQ